MKLFSVIIVVSRDVDISDVSVHTLDAIAVCPQLLLSMSFQLSSNSLVVVVVPCEIFPLTVRQLALVSCFLLSALIMTNSKTLNKTVV